MLAFSQNGPLNARLTPVTVLGETLRDAKRRVFALGVHLSDRFPDLDVSVSEDGRALLLGALRPGDVATAANSAKDFLFSYARGIER